MEPASQRSDRDGSGFDKGLLSRLITSRLEESITTAETVQLEKLLLSSADARRQFTQLVCVDAALAEEVRAREELEAASCEATIGGVTARLGCEEETANTTRHVAVTAVFAVAACLAGFAAYCGYPGVLGVQSASLRSTTVATVHRHSKDALWFCEDRSVKRGDEAFAGDTLRVSRGDIDITFSSGVVASVKAPAVVEINSPMRARVLRGKIAVSVPKGAEGFTIDTPRSTVIDLGTVFGVDVDERGQTDVVVFEGEIDLEQAADSETDEPSKRRLAMGEAVTVDYRGAVHRLVSITHDQFPTKDGRRESKRTARPPVITDVSDNLVRNESLRFYEVFMGGMGEDARAFVDRESHEWNGVDEGGMPDYLVGGDYVKTFNRDKFATEIEVRLQLAVPATVYVLFDDRVPPPRWLTETFEDTGDDIGLDEGHHQFPTGIVHPRKSGVGAGVSVDVPHSIWRRIVSPVGEVRLGGTGRSSAPYSGNVAQGSPTQPGMNMYGIVAVALDLETAVEEL